MSEQANALIDIVEPAAPVVVASGNGLWFALAGGIIILLLLIFYLWKYRLPAYQAMQRLRALHKQLHANERTPHESVLMLALELRHSLGVKRLRADKIPVQVNARDQARWPEFMQQLDELLYQHKPELSADKLAALFTRAEYWLRRYSRKSSLKKLDV
jgi:Domain of unknown function (DUF4381)